ncbi:hypothetical protein MKK75_32360 [Methylobacterium sp. J-030]|uniref:hypothetical protein n=1 Tax=Methylobacterium sp. J-030 TaxID=2836627 RepID=UPI001FBBE46F|nr:hypothetical protein [Methylobacterium sp. J-030]MCJ2073425.1 hypothetical protein [Methylobacterium sp. J-030]
MIEGDDPTAGAADALTAAGYMIERFDEDPGLWRVNGEVMTGAELLDEAKRMGLIDG